MPRLFLIDSYALAFRMYYAYAKNPLRNSRGEPVSLLHGYWGAVLRIIKMHKPEYFAIAKDVQKPTFRHELFKQYKANRAPMPQEMAEQMPFLNESLEKSGIPILGREGFEADDIMAAIAKIAAKKCSVFLITKDKDMAQVVSDKIHFYQIEKGAKGLDLGVEYVKEKFGVGPEQMIDYLALVGDSSDNVPGVAKIGPKGAVELLTKFGNLENIYEHLSELPKTKQAILEAGKENAFLSRELVTLRGDYDFGYKLEDLRYTGLKRNDLYNFFTDREVPSLIKLLPNVEEVPSLFSMLPEPAIKEIKISVRTIENLQVMEEELKSAKTLALAISENAAITVSKNESKFYEISDVSLYDEWLKSVFENENIELILYNAKSVFHNFSLCSHSKFRDVLFAQWLLRPSTNLGNAQENAAALFAKWNAIKEELEKKNLFDFFEKKEMPLLKCLYEMESEGIAIDNVALANLNSELQNRILELEEHVFAIAEERFNLASPKQLAQILYEKLNLPILKKNVSGPSTDAETLEMLLEQSEHPILEPIMNWRELQKLQTTYTEALPRLVSPKTNRIHTTFLPWGTVTGRLSSVNPNLQNIPVKSEEGKKIRAAFVARQKNWKIISVDYSQIELRMLAHLSGDPELTNAFSQNADIHSITAAKIFGTTEVSKEMRAAAKTVNFGVVYGMSAFRLARDLRISRNKAAEFIEGYFNLYGKVKEYFEQVLKSARENKYVETITGRRRYIYELNSSDHHERSTAERMAMNTPIQGSSADLIMEAMLRLHSRIEAENLPLKMLLQVHDELVFECPEENTAEFSQIIKTEMETAMLLDVPVVANVGVGDNWLEAH